MYETWFLSYHDADLAKMFPYSWITSHEGVRLPLGIKSVSHCFKIVIGLSKAHQGHNQMGRGWGWAPIRTSSPPPWCHFIGPTGVYGELPNWALVNPLWKIWVTPPTPPPAPHFEKSGCAQKYAQMTLLKKGINLLHIIHYT